VQPLFQKASGLTEAIIAAAIEKNSTGANGGNEERKGNLCSLRCLLFKSGSGGTVELGFDKSVSDGLKLNPESLRGYSRRDGDTGFG